MFNKAAALVAPRHWVSSSLSDPWEAPNFGLAGRLNKDVLEALLELWVGERNALDAPVRAGLVVATPFLRPALRAALQPELARLLAYASEDDDPWVRVLARAVGDAAGPLSLAAVSADVPSVGDTVAALRSRAACLVASSPHRDPFFRPLEEALMSARLREVAGAPPPPPPLGHGHFTPRAPKEAPQRPALPAAAPKPRPAAVVAQPLPLLAAPLPPPPRAMPPPPPKAAAPLVRAVRPADAKRKARCLDLSEVEALVRTRAEPAKPKAAPHAEQERLRAAMRERERAKLAAAAAGAAAKRLRLDSPTPAGQAGASSPDAAAAAFGHCAPPPPPPLPHAMAPAACASPPQQQHAVHLVPPPARPAPPPPPPPPPAHPPMQVAPHPSFGHGLQSQPSLTSFLAAAHYGNNGVLQCGVLQGVPVAMPVGGASTANGNGA